MPFIRNQIVFMPKTLFTLVTLILSLSYTLAQDFSNVFYGSEPQQYLDIYIAPSECPTPVYFDAHGNGGNTNMPNAIIDSLRAQGISTVAWESLTAVNTPGEVQTGWDDAALMFAWVKANADTYNFDTTQFIIGGSSRGSILSWKYAQSGDPGIIGLYMYNALPAGVWQDSTWWYAPNEVKPTAPPVFFVYRREPGCSVDPVDPDIHDPNFGFIIMDTYDALGIGDRDTLIHSILAAGNPDKYQFLPGFARSVLQPCANVSVSSFEEMPIKAYPNLFRSHLSIEGLTGNEQFALRTVTGSLLKETDQVEALELSQLAAGMYFLSIYSEEKHKTLKLIKQPE